MHEYQVVSRKDLYDRNSWDGSSLNEYDDKQETYERPPALEIVEVAVKQNEDGNSGTETQEEFDFPLFSFGDANAVSNGEDKNRTPKIPLMKISLKEPLVKLIEQERPHSYYFAELTPDARAKFRDSAIETNDILKESQLGVYRGWPQFRGHTLSIEENNAYIEGLAMRERHCKKRRPGKKQRIARKQGAINEEKRRERNKEIKKIIKKKFHKRGGVKNNKKSKFTPLKNTAIKLKFRTE